MEKKVELMFNLIQNYEWTAKCMQEVVMPATIKMKPWNLRTDYERSELIQISDDDR